ncbi:MAG: hypothetical protein WBF89_17950, partial [Steroidobacteraceae bacterium]
MSDRGRLQGGMRRRRGAAGWALAASGAVVLWLLALPTTGLAQAAKPVFKALDVFDLQWVSDPQVSPDGRSIAYVRMSYDIKTDRP